MNGFEKRKEQKKKNILGAALSLFIQSGVNKVSIAEIAKEANVSQVTIYNYFESKHNLVHEVINYYVDKEWMEYEQLLNSDIPYLEKIKKIIFHKKEIASQIHQDFYQYFMKEYSDGNSYIENFYEENALPHFIELFNEGRNEGYIDPSLSNEAIMFYIQMMKEYMRKEDVYHQVLPLTEELMKILFYGILSGKEDR